MKKEHIINDGLKLLEIKDYLNRLFLILKEKGLSYNEINLAKYEIMPIYNGKLGERKDRVCFFTPNTLMYEYGYDKFIINFERNYLAYIGS